MQRSRLLLLAVALWATELAPARAAVDYASQVKPILEKHCYSCHGPLHQKARLRLDHVAFIRQGGERGSALATKGEESLLVMVVRGVADTERMPLEAKPLADEEIAALARWIDEGAVAPDEPLPTDPRRHWSYQQPVRWPLPTVRNASWSTHPVDRFLAAAHEAHGLTSSPAAPKHVLLRRVYLDLVGVPPSPDELRTFLANDSLDGYERVVDTLLASPRYGERWGRH
ncbi:MAG TPA: DUF1549 domain-containing protein, partial [Pirellulales bacterium]|nr:DUF1549 domain-containing protein [Pirellulales bacterium]